MRATHSSPKAVHLLPGDPAHLLLRWRAKPRLPRYPKLSCLFTSLPRRIGCITAQPAAAARSCSHPVPVCVLPERAPRKPPRPCPHTQTRNSSHFGHPWRCSLLFAFSNLNTSFLLLISTVLAYSAGNFHWITSHLRQTAFLLGLEEANTGGHTPDPGWSPGIQTPGSVTALQNMVPSAQTSKWSLVCWSSACDPVVTNIAAVFVL